MSGSEKLSRQRRELTKSFRLAFAIIIGGLVVILLASPAPNIYAADPDRQQIDQSWRKGYWPQETKIATLIGLPELHLTKSATYTVPLQSGSTITYTIVVSNSGDVNATDAVISDTLPVNTNFVTNSISLDPPGAGAGGTIPPILASGLTITTGQQVTVTFAVTVSTSLTASTIITNTASITSAEVPTTTRDTVVTVVESSSIISGTIYEDLNGDAILTDALGVQNVTVLLYQDDGNGIPDVGDTLTATTTTDADGGYSFDGLSDATYWVVVDSKTVTPTAGLYGGFLQSDIWAEQTYASTGAVSFIGVYSYTSAAGAFYGGMQSEVSDDAASLSTAEHVTRVIVSGSEVTDVNSAFSFNVVTRTGDGDDDLGANRSVQGTLRQFIQNSNAISGTLASQFAIPTTDTGFDGVTGAYTIRPMASLPTISDAIILDATNQAGFAGTPIIELDGSLAGSGADGLRITAGNSTIRSLAINRYNDIGIFMSTNGSNVIIGNYIGTDVTGTTALRNGTGVYIGSDSSNNRIGGTTAAERNVIVATFFGIRIVGDTAGGNRVQGNYIGTNASGTVILGNGTGIGIYSSPNNVIGGTTAAERNIISTAVNLGLYLTGNTATGNKIQGNYVGTDVTGTTALGNSSGIRINNGAPNATIGGPTAGAGNLIAFSSAAGIRVNNFSNSFGITILGNNIYANGGLGIDLGADGVTVNDPGDSDGGPNGRMNFPVIYSAVISGGNVTIVGEARPGATVEFFEADGDASGYGEGQVFIGRAVEGSVDDTNGAVGTVDPTANQFTFVLPAGSLQPGDQLTATGTDINGNTSEFGSTFTLAADLGISKSDIPDPVLAGQWLTYTLTITNSGPSIAQSVIVTDTLPVSVSVTSVNPMTTTQIGSALSWELGTLAAGSSQRITVAVSVDSNVSGQITNTAVVTSAMLDLHPIDNQVWEPTDVSTEADLVITKDDSLDPVVASTALTYTLIVTNDGPSDAQTVVVSDTLPVSTTVLNVEPITSTQSNRTLSWDLGTVVNGGSKMITVVVTVGSNVSGIISNRAEVSASTSDPDISDNTTTEQTEVKPVVNLEIGKSSTHSPPLSPGDIITYTIVVSNSGVANATDAIISDTLSTNTEFVSDSIRLEPTGAGTAGTAPPILASGVTITAGQQLTVAFAVTVNSPLTSGTVITNLATVNSAEVVIPKTSTVTDTVANAGVSITPTEVSVSEGGITATYQVVLTSRPVATVIVNFITDSQVDPIPALSFDPLSWNSPQTVTVRAVDDTMAEATLHSSIINHTASSGDFNYDGLAIRDVTVSVADNDTVDLSIRKRSIPDWVTSGDVITYTLTVTNSGFVTASNLVMHDTLPPGVSYGDASGTGWSCGYAAGVVTCTRASLAVGAAPDVTITVTAPVTSGIITNTASISATPLDPDVTNNITTTQTLVTALTDLDLSKTATPSLVVPGQTLTYTLTYTNYGPGPANGVIITDVVPITLTDVIFLSKGAQITPSGSLSYTWQVADLVPGAGGIITITGVVSPDLITDSSFANSAIITTSATITTAVDTSPTNNDGSTLTNINLPRVSFSSANYGVDEGAGLASITVTLETAPFVTATVNYTTINGTATGNVDYTAISGTLIFTPGISSLTFTVPITDDAIDENNETVLLTLSDPSKAILATPDTASLSIIDNDTFGVSIMPTSVSVSEGGITDTYQVVLTYQPVATVTVSFNTDAQVDPIPWLSFSPLDWNSPQTVTVRAVDDAVAEATPHYSVISHTVSSSDISYDGLVVEAVTVSIADNDTVALAISKSSTPDVVAPGDTITYTIVVSNSGNANATGAVISDSLPANTEYVSGSIRLEPAGAGLAGTTLPTLASGLTITAGQRVTATFAITVSSPLTNNTLITNRVSVLSPQVPTAALSTVTNTVIATPAVNIVKSGPNEALVADTVVFTFTVNNVGNTLLQIVEVEDDYAGLATLVSGDDGDGWLELTESWIYTATYKIQPNDPNPLINTAMVTAIDALGTEVTASDSHSIAIASFTPVLVVSKSGPSAAIVGDSVVFNFTVRHAGTSDDSPVSDITVADDVAGLATLASGDTNGNNKLDASEVWIYTVNYIIKPTDLTPLVNAVTVQGRDSKRNIISATATHTMTLAGFAPALFVDKDGPTVAKTGDTVAFTFTVINLNPIALARFKIKAVSLASIGDGSPISYITVDDNLAGTATYVGGDFNGNSLLDGNEAWIYTANYTIKDTDPNPLDGIVTVQGKDQDGDVISASDTHRITILSTSPFRAFLPIILLKN